MIDRRGSIEWWSVPRFDSPSVFSRLLDPRAGHFSIQPEVPFTATRRYLDNTLVLETTFETDAGSVRLTDALALQPGARSHDIGMETPHALVRVVEGVRGQVPMRLELVPRFEYGLTVPHLRRRERGVVALAGADELHLVADAPITIDPGQARAEFLVAPGNGRAFALQHRSASGPVLDDLPPAETLLTETIAGWRSWASDHDTFRGPDLQLVRHSALVLQGLTYQPSGGVIAAATTSLPEILGGSANWDYRFVWLRDLSLTMRALWVAACPKEVGRHLELIWRALGDEREAPV